MVFEREENEMYVQESELHMKRKNKRKKVNKVRGKMKMRSIMKKMEVN